MAKISPARRLFYICSISTMVFNIVNLIFAIDTRKSIMFFDSMMEKHKDELHNMYYEKASGNVETQMSKMIGKSTLKMVILNNSDAFWVQNHTFYHGKVFNGEVDGDSVKPIDVFNASKKDINFLFDVLDDINE